MGSITGSNYSVSKRDHLIFREVVERVAKYYKVKDLTLLSYQRNAHVATARLTVYFACRLLKMRYASIAHLMGRDHTTIMMGVRSLQKKIIADPLIYEGVLVAIGKNNHE